MSWTAITYSRQQQQQLKKTMRDDNIISITDSFH